MAGREGGGRHDCLPKETLFAKDGYNKDWPPRARRAANCERSIRDAVGAATATSDSGK